MNKFIGKYIYIHYRCLSKSGKTKIYSVISNEHIILGTIKWKASWRKYAFYPEDNTLYEQDCLRDITVFLEKLKAGEFDE